MPDRRTIGVILMTYGSPAAIDDVPEFMTRVYHGKDPGEELIAEFKRRYKLIGGSPLIKLTQNQAEALQKELSAQFPNGPKFKCDAAMRFSPPFISEVTARISKKIDTLIGIIMSPQYSPIIMHGYVRMLEEAVANLPNQDLKLHIAQDWHLQPFFIQALAERVRQALEQFNPEMRSKVPVLFTAHSMPKRVIEKEPDYIEHLKETAKAVAETLKLPKSRWVFCYQSAGHTPEEWLKPDFADIMPELKEKGQTRVLIAPIQFLADHLEILYDIETGAREQAEKYGIQFARTQSLNISPLFIKALAEVVKENLN